jgi:very-short-patch-repair endonuclease
MHCCEICKKEFIPKNLKRPTRTCSKECKNKLASLNTISQFSNPAAREIQRKKSLEQKKDSNYQAKVADSMTKRTQRWTEQGHPRLGMNQPESAKQAIGKANRGRFKGKTWDEIYGKEVADRRRIENSLAMAAKNEILLKEKRSSLEEKLLPCLPNYKNNIRVGKYNVDFINEAKKHIIEVYGDYWHCNPEIYPDDFIQHHLGKSAKEIRLRDLNRQKVLESQGYTVTVVWESNLTEFIKNYDNSN